MAVEKGSKGKWGMNPISQPAFPFFCLQFPVPVILILQHALSRYVYNRSLFDIFTQVKMAEE